MHLVFHSPKVPNPPNADAVVLVVVVLPNIPRPLLEAIGFVAVPKPPNAGTIPLVPPVAMPVPVDGPTKLLKFVFPVFVLPKRLRPPAVLVIALLLVPKLPKPPNEVDVFPSVGLVFNVEPNPPNVPPPPKVGTFVPVPVDGFPKAVRAM